MGNKQILSFLLGIGSGYYFPAPGYNPSCLPSKLSYTWITIKHFPVPKKMNLQMSFWKTLRKFTLRCPLSASCLYFTNYTFIWGFPGSSDSKASAYSAGGASSIPGSGRSPGKGNGYPLQYSCLEKSHGPRSLVGYSSWGHKESDTTERLHFTSPHFTL